MIPLYVMLTAIGVTRLLGVLGWSVVDSWQISTRVGLAAMFGLTGIAHFTRTRRDLIGMVPPQFPNPEALVTMTGIAELAGAAGLLMPAVGQWAAWGLILLLVAMFPANIYAARTGHRIAGRPHTRLALRLPLQLLWIGLLWWSVR